MDQPMSKEESYVERRKLFKNIWETSLQVDDKEDIMNKPKIIKTLRLDEMDRSTAGKKKKQRIKNLRAVCNKLLDFCDRQDADDLFYEQMATEGTEPLKHLIESKVKRKLIRKTRKGCKKMKSMISSTNIATTARVTISEMKDNVKDTVTRSSMKTTSNLSPNKTKRASVSLAKRKPLKPKQSNKIHFKNDNSETSSLLQKLNKKLSKNKPVIKTVQPGINT